MNLRRKVLGVLALAIVFGLGSSALAQPLFENNTPRGFTPADSTITDTSIIGNEVNVLVDLNQPANHQYPVIGNFQRLERSVPYFSSGSSAAYMSQAMTMDANGVIHRAWVQKRGTVDLTNPASTPLYGVVYARSLDGGRSFSDTVSVSGSLRFDQMTPDALYRSGFSTVDIVVNSRGNPRVVYAMQMSAGGLDLTVDESRTAATGEKMYQMIYFNYSNDGGSSWLPANSAVAVNDTATVGVGSSFPGRNVAFPRMTIANNDDIFLTYEANLWSDEPHIRLAKVPEDSLKLGNGQQQLVGALGTVGSLGGVRINPVDAATRRDLAPDIAIGDGNVLHVVWHMNHTTPENSEIQHKTVPASMWDDISVMGWDQSQPGARVGGIDQRDVPAGGYAMLRDQGEGQATPASVAAGLSRLRLFPSVAVDRARTPDRIYALWKHAGPAMADENIRYNQYDYNGQTGAPSGWLGTPRSAFPTADALYSTSGGGLFQNQTRFQIENGWAFTDRIAVALDARKGTSSDLHIVFSGGPTQVTSTDAAGNGGHLAAALNAGSYNKLYYTRFNGTEWELPQVVATAGDARGPLGEGEIAPHGVLGRYRMLFEPRISMRAGDDNVYLAFVGGSPSLNAVNLAGENVGATPGRGLSYGVGGVGTIAPGGSIAPVPFFKRLGRVTTFEDRSRPTGAYQYILSYTPLHPQTIGLPLAYDATTGNYLDAPAMVTVTAADHVTGAGIGAATPGTSRAPGGFLTGQWRQFSLHSLGVASLQPGMAGAVYKGAVSESQAANNTGIWEGQINDSGPDAFGEWGDNDDKRGLLVKLNVLSSNSVDQGTGGDAWGATYIISSSTAAKLPSGNKSQSLSLVGYSVDERPSFVRGITGEAASDGTTAPLGSYFQIGARIDIVGANVAPVVAVLTPDASTAAAGSVSEQATIRYILYDEDDSFTGNLKASLYYYPDSGLSTVQDIRTFGTLIVDHTDDTSVPQGNLPGTGTNDFLESSSAGNVRSYSWRNPGTELQRRGWAPLTKTRQGLYYIYIVADDGLNPPVFAVSPGPFRVRHIPIVRSVSPVAADTVDTGEFVDQQKINPYTITFDLVDYDDNAQARLFYSQSGSLGADDVSIEGSFPNLEINLVGAEPIQLSDTLRTDEHSRFAFDVTAQGSEQNELVPQGVYYIYAVAADGDSFAVAPSAAPLFVRHSPAFEFTAPMTGTLEKINTTQQTRYTIQWQRGRTRDLQGDARIALYYTGVDPQVHNYTGTDSTRLLASSGANPGNATLIAGGMPVAETGKGQQFVWDFRNPPSELPRIYRPEHGGVSPYNPHLYQVGAVTDTAWLYAVLHDDLGNTRVQAGGAILLLGSSESPGSRTPRVVMKTPPAGGQTMINGDIVRVEWDDWLIDDGTGTNNAYLRLYAAPRGKYSSLEELEANNIGHPSGLGDVIVLNSLDGTTYDAGNNPVLDHVGAPENKVRRIRGNDPSYFMWDTRTTSFKLEGTPTEFDIFIAASMNPRFGTPRTINTSIDSIGSGIGSQAQRAVLSRSPGALRIEGSAAIHSIELSPSVLTASSGDTLDFQVMVNSQNSSVDLMAFHLDVPRRFFEVIDQDPDREGLQPFANASGAFQTPSTIAQNDTTPGNDEFIKLNFVESIVTGEVIGNASGDSSQVAATLQLRVNQFSAGAPLDTTLVWANEAGRRTALRRGNQSMAAPARDTHIKLTPRARLIATVPLEGRSVSYSDTLEIHLREIGSTHNITDPYYVIANTIRLDTLSTAPELVRIWQERRRSSTTRQDGDTLWIERLDEIITQSEYGSEQITLSDSVWVISDNFGTFVLEEIPPGIYEMTVKAPGYVTGRTDTLHLFNGMTTTVDPTYGSDLLGNLSPATPLGYLRGGDAIGNNRIDIADANFIFELWNKTAADPEYVRSADINQDGVINALDLGFVTTNFGNEGYGAAPVWRPSHAAGDNSAAIVEILGVDGVDGWWPGRMFEVTARLHDAADVMAFGLSLGYDPRRVQPVGGDDGVTEGDIFASNPHGSLFFYREEPGRIDITGGRIGNGWSASGDGDLARVRFVSLTDDPGDIKIVGGELVNSGYAGTPLRTASAEALPKVVTLYENYPNPFNPSTEIRFDIPTTRDVRLRIYNQLGQTVRTLVDQQMKAGSYRILWDATTENGKEVSSGVYFYGLEAGEFNQIRKMTLIK